MPRPIASIRNLGPASARLLGEAGIATADQLAGLGAVAAYRRARFVHGARALLNLLWAIHAGLQGRHWRDLTPAEKAALKAELGRD